jgi:peptidyl-prolyl cis-trans isomerase C
VRTRQLSAATLVMSLLAVLPALAGTASVAARVNGVPITAAQVDKLAQRMAAAQGGSPDAAKQEALQALIDIELITQQAKAEKIEVPRAEVDQHINEIKSRYPTPGAFKEVLAANQATEAELRADLTRSALVKRVLDKHVTVALAPDAAEQFYKANPDKFHHDAEVRVSHILFVVPSDGLGSAAKQRATDTLARLKKGEDFGTLAKELSDDPGSKEQGGDLGFMAREGALKEFADVAFTLKPGEVSDVVHTKYGYHIIKVTETRAAGAIPLDEVRSQLDHFLQDQERDKQQQAYVEGLKKQAKIEIVAPKK